MDDLIFIETVLYDSTKGICLNFREISSFYGDGRSTFVLMKSGRTHTVRDSFEEFCKKLNRVFE